MAETKDSADQSTTLKAFAGDHLNGLFDAVALLDAAAERIDFATPATTEDKERADSMHNTLRLVQMASEKVKFIADVLFDEN